MTPNDFIAKWKNGGDERRDAQPFFEDLCRLIGHQTPREADPDHTWFTYEYGASKTNGGDGWADVWKKGKFGWEAKGTHKNLDKAYEQLKMYADALENPPLLVVSDLQTIIIHTNFTNTVKKTFSFTVEELINPENIRLLKNVFDNPDALRPGVTRTGLTKDAAEKFTTLAESLNARYNDPQAVAHFLNRLLFCMFAEDILLLPNDLFTRLVTTCQGKPDLFEKLCSELFEAMHKGGNMALENIDWFNGGLFDDNTTLRLNTDELKVLFAACQLEWDEIEPSIFGTLFERGLDPSKRSQLGAHYTDPATIMKIVGPVVVEPWQQAWELEKVELVKQLAKATKTVSQAANKRFTEFLERLRAFTVLDPACGSGNFLYLSLRALKDLEKQFINEGEAIGLVRQFPSVGPSSVKGIELNSYAAELARITIWIGEIQWMIQNGYGARKNPILNPLDQIETRDALVNQNNNVASWPASEADWPAADAIVGNPPFIGGHKMKGELGESYSTTVRNLYKDRIEGGADFVCFWFDKARKSIESGISKRAGLVATNSIGDGASRVTLDKIKEKGVIYTAWSDEDWVNDGAAVTVSLICFSSKATTNNPAKLNGKVVGEVTSSLKELVHYDIAKAKALKFNKGVAFQGVIPRGEIKKKQKIALGLPDASFVLDGPTARAMLTQPATPKGDPISKVVMPYCIADDITTRPLDRFIVNFGQMDVKEAAMYAEPFAAIATVKLHRDQMEDGKDKRNWWQLARLREKMLTKLRVLPRYIAVARVSKHHIVSWMPSSVIPDNAVVVIARDDETTMGILQSRIHELWALGMGSELEDRPRYTHTTSFETFPFPIDLGPEVPADNYAANVHSIAIAKACKDLLDARNNWLNPPAWVNIIPEVVAGYPDRVVAKPGKEAELKKRTLTELYNANEPWIRNLHDELDKTVATAYGWPWPLSDDEILKRLFELNKKRQ